MDLFQYSLLKNNPLYEGALPNNSDWNSLLEKADKLVSVSILRKQYSNIRSIIAKIGHIDKFIEPQAIFIEQLLKSNSNIANSNYEDEIVGKLKNLNFTSSESLYYWLQQHTSTLKADIQPDTLSSFEFYKSRAAFAHCLAKETVSEYPFILLCVDISGIQDFIYNIHSRRASKSLKGRSFYLGLILDAIQKSILQATKMPICNVIYGNGGKSYLLLPNTEGVNSVSNKLKEIYDKVNGALFNEYQGSLYCCMAWSAFNINEHYNIACNELLRDKTPVEGLNDLWRLVTEKASLQKQKKFRHLLDSRFTDFFSGTLHTEDINSLQTAICAVSGLPTQKIRENIIDGNKSDVNDETNVFVRSEIMIQINLGEQLKDCNYIEISYIKQDNTWIEPLELGVYYKLSSTNESQTECYCINPTTNDEWWSEGCTGYWFYGGNQQAIVKDSKTGETRWKTFEELATPNEDKGFNKLAILRMDVDNLGDVFTKGLGNDNKYRTFATYSALSSTLDHFFSGYLNSIRNHTDYKDYVNIIYSGGDDVFVVGRWKEVIAFANEVQRDFYQLSDGKLTLSAGITVINPKFPIQKSAELAKVALDDYAKDFKLNTSNLKPSKNAIHLFDTTVSWDKEWQFVYTLSYKMSTLIADNTLTKGLVYKLFEYQNMKNDTENTNRNFQWRWQSAYSFARYEQNAKEEQAPFLKAIKYALISTRFDFESISHKTNSAERMLDLICLAAQLADYDNR